MPIKEKCQKKVLIWGFHQFLLTLLEKESIKNFGITVQEPVVPRQVQKEEIDFYQLSYF